MTTAVVSPFYDFSEVMNKNDKMLNYNNNLLSTPHHPISTNIPMSITNPTGALLDRKAVGTPSLGCGLSVYKRRHSVTLPNHNPSSKFNQNQFLNSLKTIDHSSCSITSGFIGSGSSNKENRMRDRSFSETGERLLHQCLGPASPTSLGALSQQQSQVNSSRYKTELCRPFEENGACKYGDKCQFAHGFHELRSLSRHPKYKTELCRTFHTIGFCPYGPRCHFIHNAEERRGPPPSPSSCSSYSPLSSNKLERPRLQHSYSFAGFPSSGGLRGGDSPTSVTPPPMFSPDEIPEWPSSNLFTYSSQELANLFGPSLGSGDHVGTDPKAPAPPSQNNTPYFFRPMSESPTQIFASPSSPPQDSLSDQEGYQSSSGGSLSGSESPSLDANRRLPIFSRLSVSDD
ncbi:mRNA decay activator protein ZFP36L1-like [Salvelinus alpinus]|uniref:mRNA decay activator protein ZFP36L1-like n=1 Tax=Salvelinus alpinus TaxID=8036 RepID=UPI0039FBF3BE